MCVWGSEAADGNSYEEEEHLENFLILWLSVELCDGTICQAGEPFKELEPDSAPLKK